MPKQFCITEKTCIVGNKYKTKLHTCFEISQQIELVRYEEGFKLTLRLVVFFLVTNSCNLSCYIKTSL